MVDRHVPQRNGARRALVVSAVDPYPTDAGKKVVLAGLLAHLADRLGPDNVHYGLVGRPEDVPETFPVRLHPLRRPSTREQLKSVVTRVPTGRSSLQEALLRGQAVAAGVRAAVDEVDPDLVVLDTVRFAQYLAQVPARPGRRVVCYLDDLFSERYAGMLAARRRFADVRIEPLGNFGALVPARLRPLAEWGPTQKLLLAAEQRLVARSERRAAAAFDRCLLVNANEAGLLAGRVPGSTVLAVPPLVRPAGRARTELPTGPHFVMLGLLSLAHNEDGLVWFLREVLPRLREREPGATLTVVGRGAGTRVTELAAAAGDAVRLMGWVDDLDELLCRSAALVNPLRFGSGIKLKVLEALARGLPVVSTPVGADGIEAGPGTGITVADTPDAFAAAMVELTAPERAGAAGREASEHYARTYSREAVFARYDEALLSADRGVPAPGRSAG